jgi:hypothetical protein
MEKTNGYTAQVSPWSTLQGELIDAFDGLDQANYRLADALGEQARALVALDAAKQVAEDVESEFTGEIMFSLEFQDNKSIQKNAESRKAYMDLRLVRARKPGGVMYYAAEALTKAKEDRLLADNEVELAKRQVLAIQAKIDALSSLVRGLSA